MSRHAAKKILFTPKRILLFSAIGVLLIAGIVFAILFLRPTGPKPTALKIDREELTFSSLTESARIGVTAEPENASLRGLTFSSSDESVAFAKKDGTVIPVGTGNAVITVSCGDVSVTIPVKVILLEGILLSDHNVTLSVGAVSQLLYVLSPDGFPEITVQWKSSDENVVTVDSNGVITGVSSGKAIVTASFGTVSDSCEVQVTQNVPLESIAFPTSSFSFVSETDRLFLTPVFTPVDTSERNLLWTSSDERIATVDPNTFEVKALSNGVCTVTAQTPDGRVTCSCTITVAQNIPLTGMTLSKTSHTFAGPGQSYLISPVFSPVNASDKRVTWTSSDEKIATVSDTGLITSVTPGTCTIRLVTAQGGFSAEFFVTVQRASVVPVTGISMKSFLKEVVGIGKTFSVSAVVQPNNATDKTLKYVSKNPSVAKVSSAGTVTTTGYGTAQITVTTANGKYSENLVVIVSSPEVDSTETINAEYVKGVWVATVSNLNFPSKAGLSEAKLKAEIDTIMDNIVSWNLNTVYFQVRPAGDAFYPSSIYPTSAYLVKAQGDELPFDVLAYAVKAAHTRGLSFHAWINPYRALVGTDRSKLAASSPAALHPDWLCTDGKKLYFNPGIPEVRQMVISGATEIVRNYAVDGIHLDDYFYPDDLSLWDDAAQYAKYGNGMTLADWRRNNNDLLVSGLYNAVKEIKASVQFGISPAAVWALESYQKGGVEIKSAYQTYSQAYADTKKWVEQGWLDYICPQVYFQTDHSTAPFKPIVDWWDRLVADTDVDLFVGIGAYKCETVASFQSGKEIPLQLDYLDTKENVIGAVFYSYDSLLKNHAGCCDQVKARYEEEPVSTTLEFSTPSMTVPNATVSTFIVGVSDPSSPLTANGEAVERTTDGYFSYPVTLKVGKNVVTFKHKGKTVEYVVTRKESDSTGTSGYLSSFGFEAGSFKPVSDVAAESGTKITFSCVAPAGSSVSVSFGGYKVSLKTTTSDPKNGKYKKATYTGTMVLPESEDEANTMLGYVVFTATRNGETETYSSGKTVEIINNPANYSMVITDDYRADVRPNLTVDPASYLVGTAGSKVHIVSKADGLAKTDCGMYLDLEDLGPCPQTYTTADVLSSSMTQSGKYTVLTFKMSDAAFHTVWMDETFVEICFYNVRKDSYPALKLTDNPLFSEIKETWLNDTTLVMHLTLKERLHVYGYLPNFDGNTLYLRFRNPVTLSSGEQPLKGVLISLDPGHSMGGSATGTFNGVTHTEEEWNLQLSLLVKERLEAFGATVVLSHQGEHVYTLDELIPQFSALNPDINVSIHFNDVAYNTDPLNYKGTYTYWCFGNSHLLSDVLLREFTKATGLKMNQSRCGYYKVSRMMTFPSILFETAFIRNPSDFSYFCTEEGMAAAADALSNGILTYFRETQPNGD